jgi:superfamily II DNA or RNA helicase
MELRDYQKGATKSVLDTKLGQVILPTGTGKSIIQSTVIELRIEQGNRGFGVFVIITPRILLTNQLMRSAVKHLADTDINLSTHTIHSGGVVQLYEKDDDAEFRAWADQCRGDSSTGKKELTAAIELAKAQNRPLLVCSTYHSCGILATVLADMKLTAKQVLCDEAHYIIEDNFFDSIKRVKAVTENMHFFTATRKVTDNDTGNGMDNETFYGKVVFTRTPAQMIKAGWMVRPRIHYADTSANAAWDKMIEDAYKEHKILLTSKQTAKMLVCCDGSATINEIASPSFRAMCKDNSITLFDISSAFGPRINGEARTRDEFLTQLRSHKGEAIILHINILTEGIDVPDMSGVLFIRNMNMSRLLQSVGRATRPHLADMTKSFKPKYSTNQLEKWATPYAWVIVAERNNETDKKSNIERIIRDMRLAGFEQEETVVVAVDKGTKKPVEFDPTKIADPKINSQYAKLFNILHTIEREELVAAFTKKSYLDKIATISSMTLTV